MRLRSWLLCLAGTSLASVQCVQAGEQPVTAKDYYSLQIASGKDAKALKALYQHHASLPFVRIERRGALHVLRAGFWTDQRSAHAALSQIPGEGGFVRIAVFKPDAIVQRNWGERLAGDASPAVTGKAEPVTPLAAAVATAARPARRIEPEARSDAGVFRAFNQEDFSLAYDALLGSGDLEQAFRIAQQAVQQVPGDAAWRRKLGRVADWTQRPVLAAAQWQALFLKGDRAEDTVSAVIRLAPLLETPLLALQAWEFRAARATLSVLQWADVFRLYESLAEPQRGSLFFEAQYRQTRLPLLLEYAARLAEHAGLEQQALSLNLQRLQLTPFSMEILLRTVVNLIQHDQLGEALALMQAHEGKVSGDDVEFWRLLGQVAWSQRDFASAQDAYQRFAQTSEASVADWSRLVFLMRQKHPAQAASLALQAYRRFGAQEHLLLALDLYAASGDVQAQARVFNSLSADELAQAERGIRFLMLRSQFQRQQNKPELAWTDLQQALKLGPDDADVIQSALWFLIDEQRTDELSLAVRRHVSLAVEDSRFWPVYAAASGLLNRPRDATNWYRKAVTQNPDDPLLLLNYADALERSQSVGMAARIRRHAWLLLKKKHPQPEIDKGLDQAPELQALARMVLLNQPGDPGLQRVRELLNRLRGIPAEGAERAQATELVLGWAILKEQFPNARAWMWQRYARHVQAAPLWAQSQVALQLGDTQAMAGLLKQESRALPIYNKYDMTYALGHAQQALDVSFQGMSQTVDDEPLYDRFRQHAPVHANYVQIQLEGEDQGSFRRQGVQLEARLVPHARLHAVLGWSRQLPSSDDPVLSSLASTADRLERIEALWLGDRGESGLTLFRRHELQSYTGLQLRQSGQLGQRLNLEAGLDYRADATLSLPLRLAGYENSLYGHLNYALGKREYLRFSPRLTRYYTQFGDYLGAGNSLDLELGYRIRTQYPDWLLRVFSSHQGLSYDGGIGPNSLARLPGELQTGIATGGMDPVRYFLPQGSNTWGACLSMGENLAGQSLQTGYSRAWRPFTSLCLRHNTLTGDGYAGTLGLAGSLTGEDHLSIQWQNSDGAEPASAPAHLFSIRYRYYF